MVIRWQKVVKNLIWELSGAILISAWTYLTTGDLAQTGIIAFAWPLGRFLLRWPYEVIFKATVNRIKKH